MCSGIPVGTYELKIGASFLGSSKSRPPEFNTLRFDFKPASISTGASDAYIVQQNQNENNFQVVVLGEAQKQTIFKGAKKEIKGDKECLLVFDGQRKELSLERVSANINVKKTRNNDLDQRATSEIERLQNRKKPKVQPQKAAESVVVERKERTFSASSAGDEIDEDDEENVSALEQLMAPPVKVESIRVQPEEIVQPPPPQQQKLSQKMETDDDHSQTRQSVAAAEREQREKEQQPQLSPQQQQPMPVKKTSSFVRKSILAEDLQLSESSSSSSDNDTGGEDNDGDGGDTD